MSDRDSGADVRRRRLLGTGGAALALSTVAASAQAARGQAAAYSVTRARFTLAADAVLPKSNVVYVLPLAVTALQDSADVTLQADNTLLINTTGLYRVCLSVDWPGQHGVDMDLRMYGIMRKKAPKVLGRLTKVTGKDDRLAEVDVPGSDPPQMGRYQGSWSPGVVPLGGFVTTLVTVAPGAIVNVGDVALASHTGISDATLGVAGSTALIVQAKVVAADTVRVSLYNPSIAAGISIPPGTLQVMAMSAVNTRGESADAWTVLQTSTEELLVGETVYAYFKSKVTGDYVQATDQTFLQIERWA